MKRLFKQQEITEAMVAAVEQMRHHAAHIAIIFCDMPGEPPKRLLAAYKAFVEELDEFYERVNKGRSR